MTEQQRKAIEDDDYFFHHRQAAGDKRTDTLPGYSAVVIATADTILRATMGSNLQNTGGLMMDIEALKEELERAIKIYKPDGDFGYGTLYNIACHFAQWGHDKTVEKMPHWKPAARAYLNYRLPKMDYSLNRVVARDEDGAYYLTMNDLYRLPKDNDFHEED